MTDSPEFIPSFQRKQVELLTAILDRIEIESIRHMTPEEYLCRALDIEARVAKEMHKLTLALNALRRDFRREPLKAKPRKRARK